RSVARRDPERGAENHRRRRAYPSHAAAGAIPPMFDGDLLRERARVTPDKLAVVCVGTGQRLTYAQLDERVERAAATLRTLLEPGDRFGLLAHNSLEFLDLFFAAGRAGVIVV